MPVVKSERKKIKLMFKELLEQDKRNSEEPQNESLPMSQTMPKSNSVSQLANCQPTSHFFLSTKEQKSLTKEERTKNILHRDFSRHIITLKKQFEFYKPHEKVRFRLILEKQNTSFMNNPPSDISTVRKEKPDPTLKP